MARTREIDDEQILESARKTFISSGLRATVRSVARLAGISEGVIFQRFGTKDALIAAAFAPRSAAEPDPQERQGGDPEKAFEDLAVSLFAVARIEAPSSIPLLHRQAQPPPPLTAADGAFTRAWKVLERHLSGEAARGRAASDPVKAAAFMLAAALHHAALFEAVGGASPHVNEQAVRRMARALWRGLAPAPDADVTPPARRD